MVVIVSRGKALLPLHSGVARLFLVRVPNLYFGSIQYSWGTWLGSSAQREAQPDRRGLQWLPHLKYSTISGFPSDRWWWYTDIYLWGAPEVPFKDGFITMDHHNQVDAQYYSWCLRNAILRRKELSFTRSPHPTTLEFVKLGQLMLRQRSSWQKECSTLICGLCWSVLHDLLPLVVFNLMMIVNLSFSWKYKRKPFWFWKR